MRLRFFKRSKQAVEVGNDIILEEFEALVKT